MAGLPFTFSGKHFQVSEATLRPGPVQQPRVPVLLAGGGERVTLRQVATTPTSPISDRTTGSEAPPLPPYLCKYAVLRQHCAALGRDYDLTCAVTARLPCW